VAKGLEPGDYLLRCRRITTRVGQFSITERRGVPTQYLVEELVADEVIQHNGIHVDDRQEADESVLVLINEECLVESEHADTVIDVELRHILEEICA
jgi:hypothetical protein